MIDRNYIKRRETFFIDEYHSLRKGEQEIDQDFYDDVFPVPLLKDNLTLKQRTGEAARLIDVPARSIVTSNPQAFREPRSKKDIDSAGRVGELLNNIIRQLQLQNPDPFREHPKDSLLRGESWIRTRYDRDWRLNGRRFPVWLTVPDPLTIFASPEEIDGVPEEVIVRYERQWDDVGHIWKDWSNPLHRGEDGKGLKAVWMEYWGVDRTEGEPVWVRYFEADGETILPGQDGIQINVLKFNPFVHSFSGLGKGSPEGDPESQAVGRLRPVRSILEEECALSSDIMSLIHRHAYGYSDFTRAVNSNVADNALDTYDESPHKYNLLPVGVTPVLHEDKLSSLAALFTQLSNVRARLDREAPSFIQGAPIGSSGRHANLTETRVEQQWDSVVDREQLAFSVALGQCLRILNEQPNMMPVTVYASALVDGEEIRKEDKVVKNDINGNYDCTIEMKASSAIQKDRDAQMFKQGRDTGLFTTETTLVKGYGFTPEKARDEIDNRMVEDVTINFPPWRMAMAVLYAQQAGIPIEQFLGQEGGGQAPRPTERQTAQGRLEADVGNQQSGVRQPPQGGF